MTSMFHNLADQRAKLSDSHPGNWLFDGKPECGKVAGAGTTISKQGRFRIPHRQDGKE
jgi:hypothetical protein